MKKVALYMMGEKGAISLNKLLQSINPIHVEFVIGARDNGMLNDYYEEIKKICDHYSVPFFDRSETTKHTSQYAIAIAWKWLIHTDSEKKLIVFHDSILPKYRGYAPLVSSLINNEKELGVTAIWATEEYDKGDIIAQEKIKINYPIKIKNAVELIANLYAKILINIFSDLIADKPIIATKQNESEATYSIWRDDHDYTIDWGKDADFIKRFVDAVGYPYRGATSYLEDKKVIIHDCEIVNDVNFEIRDVGKVFKIENGNPFVICKKGMIKITNITEVNSSSSLLPFKKIRSRFQKI